jgi:uncharacterized membrane protein
LQWTTDNDNEGRKITVKITIVVLVVVVIILVVVVLVLVLIVVLVVVDSVYVVLILWFGGRTFFHSGSSDFNTLLCYCLPNYCNYNETTIIMIGLITRLLRLENWLLYS